MLVLFTSNFRLGVDMQCSFVTFMGDRQQKDQYWKKSSNILLSYGERRVKDNDLKAGIIKHWWLIAGEFHKSSVAEIITCVHVRRVPLFALN